MTLTYPKNGETLALDPSKCTGCGACVDVCPHAVFGMTGGATGGVSGAIAACRSDGDPGRVAVILRRAQCMECGACALNCPAGAVSVTPGVGCAAAIMIGKLNGRTPGCGDAECCEGIGKKTKCC